jgi:hypothetical protein
LPYQDDVDCSFASSAFIESRLKGLLRYIVEEMKLANESRLSGYINRHIYRNASYDERFNIETVDENVVLLSDVALKKGCQNIHVSWYKQTAREYRVLNIGSLYGISLLEYYELPSYVQEVIRDEAIEVQNRRQSDPSPDNYLKDLEKSSRMFDESQLAKLR